MQARGDGSGTGETNAAAGRAPIETGGRPRGSEQPRETAQLRTALEAANARIDAMAAELDLVRADAAEKDSLALAVRDARGLIGQLRKQLDRSVRELQEMRAKAQYWLARFRTEDTKRRVAERRLAKRRSQMKARLNAALQRIEDGVVPGGLLRREPELRASALGHWRELYSVRSRDAGRDHTPPTGQPQGSDRGDAADQRRASLRAMAPSGRWLGEKNRGASPAVTATMERMTATAARMRRAFEAEIALLQGRVRKAEAALSVARAARSTRDEAPAAGSVAPQDEGGTEPTLPSAPALQTTNVQAGNHNAPSSDKGQENAEPAPIETVRPSGTGAVHGDAVQDAPAATATGMVVELPGAVTSGMRGADRTAVTHAHCPPPYADVSAMPGGRSRIALTDPCRPGTRFSVTHAGITMEGRFDGTGIATVPIDAAGAGDEKVVVETVDARRIEVTPKFEDRDRLAKLTVIWNAPVEIKLSAWRRTTRGAADGGGPDGGADFAGAGDVASSESLQRLQFTGPRRATLTVPLPKRSLTRPAVPHQVATALSVLASARRNGEAAPATPHACSDGTTFDLKYRLIVHRPAADLLVEDRTLAGVACPGTRTDRQPRRVLHAPDTDAVPDLVFE